MWAAGDCVVPLPSQQWMHALRSMLQSVGCCIPSTLFLSGVVHVGLLTTSNTATALLSASGSTQLWFLVQGYGGAML